MISSFSPRCCWSIGWTTARAFSLLQQFNVNRLSTAKSSCSKSQLLHWLQLSTLTTFTVMRLGAEWSAQNVLHTWFWSACDNVHAAMKRDWRHCRTACSGRTAWIRLVVHGESYDVFPAEPNDNTAHGVDRKKYLLENKLNKKYNDAIKINRWRLSEKAQAHQRLPPLTDKINVYKLIHTKTYSLNNNQFWSKPCNIATVAKQKKTQPKQPITSLSFYMHNENLFTIFLNI